MSIAAGHCKRLDLPVARLPTQTLISLPVTVLHGQKDGPCLWLSAAIHGDELNGIGLIHRLLSELNPQELSGTVVAVPVVNHVMDPGRWR